MRVFSIQYEEADGTVRTVEITSDGQQKELAETVPQIGFESNLNGRAFVAATIQTAATLTMTATGGIFLFLKNTSATYDIVLTDILISADTAGGILCILGNLTVGTVAKKNDHTPANLNFGSVNAPTTTCYIWDETGDGITGLTGGDKLATYIIPAKTCRIFLDGEIVLRNGKNMVLQFTGKAAEISASIAFVEVVAA